MAYLFNIILPLAALVFTSSAHMVMKFPPPVGGNDNAPLVQSKGGVGGNYPCRVSSASAYSAVPPTKFNPGDTMQVSFLGSAVHGGGSCQFSLTKDAVPNKNSIFKVIHSVEGGCPVRGVSGNLVGGPDTIDPSQYPVTIPSSIEPGSYVFAWSWINKVGNREFYMNCSPVQIGSAGSGSSNTNRGSSNFFDSLPDMVTANIESDAGSCTNPENGKSFRFANPGASVERNENLTDDDLVFPQCFAGGRKISSKAELGSRPGSGSSSTTQGSPGFRTSTISTTASVSTALTTLTTAPTLTTLATSATSSATPRPTPGFAGGNGANDGSGSSSECSSLVPHICTKAGFECASASCFVNCVAAGQSVTAQPMAEGTTCVDGAIVKRSVTGRRHAVHRFHNRGWNHRS